MRDASRPPSCDSAAPNASTTLMSMSRYPILLICEAPTAPPSLGWLGPECSSRGCTKPGNRGEEFKYLDVREFRLL